MGKLTPSVEAPLKRAKALGSSHHGAEHWWMERLTSIALVPLVIWFVSVVISLVRADHFQVVEYFKSPIHAILMALFVIFSFYHTALGLQVVVEDYVHSKVKKFTTLVVIKLGLFIFAVATLAAIAKMHFSA